MAESPQQIEAATLATERAIDEFRRQLGLVVQGTRGRQAVLPMEWVTSDYFKQFQSLAAPALLISGARALYLGLGALPLRIEALGLTLEQLQQLANPALPIDGLPALSHHALSESEHAALLVAKHAALLPALLTADLPAASPFSHWQSLDADAVRLYHKAPLLDVLPATGASLPIEGAENARLESFRSRYGSAVHLALVIGDIASVDAPLVRVHSSCVTGDILGSLRCDCGGQLRKSLAAIRKAGTGVLIYLHQEGRGIGIVNKLRAYHLQECGMDTFDANLALGFDEDERDFSIAASMLKHLGISHIRLLTNNPHKLAALEDYGVQVCERVGLTAGQSSHNESYLKAKAEKSGHLF